jgi:hypothetical protein
MERQRDFRGYEVAKENADCICNSLADLPAILRIQSPPTAPT